LINSLPVVENSLPEITGNLQPPNIVNRLESRRIFRQSQGGDPLKPGP
jgi:hypothetical protein